jgi:ketosteroid isomerase-like protein
MNTSQEQMIDKVEVWIAEMRAWWKETLTCQEATEACLESKEAPSLVVESVVVHEEVPKEEASVESFGTLKKQHRDSV